MRYSQQVALPVLRCKAAPNRLLEQTFTLKAHPNLQWAARKWMAKEFVFQNVTLKDCHLLSLCRLTSTMDSELAEAVWQ